MKIVVVRGFKTLREAEDFNLNDLDNPIKNRCIKALRVALDAHELVTIRNEMLIKLGLFPCFSLLDEKKVKEITSDPRVAQNFMET